MTLATPSAVPVATRPAGRDLPFLTGVVLLSALGVYLLAAHAPFGEDRFRLGIYSGWGLALAVMLPSHAIHVAVLRRQDPRALQRALLFGSALRLFGSGIGMLIFALAVADPPMTAFLLSFLAGYFAVGGLELVIATAGRGGRAAR